MTSNSVIVSMKLCLDVGNDEYTPLYSTPYHRRRKQKKKNGLIRIGLRLLFCKDVQRNININRYVSRATIQPSASSQVQQAVSTCYFKLPYVGSFTREAQIRIRKLVQRYCTNIEIKLAFSSFKVGSMFSVKDPVPLDLRSRVVYKFLCAECNACYIRETSRHLSTRVLSI